MQIALTIAGSDSGGGAGIQADLKTFHAFGVFGTSVLTAVTAQNTRGVQAVHVVPAAMVVQQIRSVSEDLRPAACKSGMLASREVIEAMAGAMLEFELRNYVLDPVMVATSGDRLLDEGAEESIARRLLPLCTVVTPNLEEAAILTGRPVADVAGMREAAHALVQMGARAALVKGGHLSGEVVLDMLFDGQQVRTFRRPKIATRSTHGTGCTLSAAIAAGLARGRDLPRAVEDALEFVHNAIAQAPQLGSGNGPLNHFVAAPTVAFADPGESTTSPQ